MDKGFKLMTGFIDFLKSTDITDHKIETRKLTSRALMNALSKFKDSYMRDRVESHSK